MANSWCEKVNIFGSWFGNSSQKQPAAPGTKGDTAVVEEDAIEKEQRAQEHKQMMLRGQREREDIAIKSAKFVKSQRARYLHKASDEWFDAFVVGVHLDDGPDNPYYTIKYQTNDGGWIEKQTTGDRLAFVEWDDQLSWEILSKKLHK